MAYSNYLLFNNVFLRNLKPSEEELVAARYLVHESARDWYKEEHFNTPRQIAEDWVKRIFNQQSLDLVPSDLDEFAWYLVAPWDRDSPLALCYVTPKDTSLDGFTSDGSLPKGQHWMIQAVNLARSQPELNLRWVVLTNGVQWRLLDATALRRYEAYLEIDLFSLLNGEDDPLAAYLFYRIFRLEDSMEREEETGHNRLDAFLAESILATEATEKYLKTTVSDNLAIPGEGDGILAQLCMGIVHVVDPDGTKTFTDKERAAIYRDASYLLYRLLFILYAEARNLLPMNRPDYKAVSLHHLVNEAAELYDNPSKAVTKPTSLWEQLDTLCNAVHYSDEYLGIPPYNGGLFDNRDKPYLRDFQIENVYLADALYELAYLLDEKGERPPQRIDYCDLSVRHLGNLYEGMIEYHLFIAEEELLARRDKSGKVKYIPSAENRLKPTDEVVQAGKVYFAQSPHERKATGTHYTPEYLVARLVKQTVGRLMDERWSEFQLKLDQWLVEIESTPVIDTQRRLQVFTDSQLEIFVQEQVFSLRICDPAMGSGHFLVHIAHTLTNFILQTISNTDWENLEVNLDPNRWRRQVVENCLYGVDINNMAVELAKLSLWLATMQLGRPLSFLDHHLKLGNSLLGVGLDEITAMLESGAFNQETHQTRVAEARGQYGFRELPQVQQKLAQANDLLACIAARRVERIVDVEAQEIDCETIQALLKPYKQIGDLLVAQKMGWKVKDADLRSLAITLEIEAPEMLSDVQKQMLVQAQTLVGTQQSLHWPLEFPQVLLVGGEQKGGFNVVIGNPPFLGGLKISRELSSQFLRFIKVSYAPTFGVADLCTYFFRLGFQLIHFGGCFGMVATNTIAQGDSRQTGLAVILQNNGKIVYADRFVKWGGDANVEVNLVSLVKTNSNDQIINPILDNKGVPQISSYLDDLPDMTVKRLVINAGKSYQGDILYGAGFIITSDERRRLLEQDLNNEICILPYVMGDDINSHISKLTDRFAICFFDWSLERAKKFPDLLNIVIKRVKPIRDNVKNDSSGKNWWLFGRYRKSMRDATSDLEKVLVRSQVSEFHMLTMTYPKQILSSTVIVIAYSDYYHFSLLQSHIHEVWLRRQASTMRTDIRYTPTDCFQTFPFPQNLSEQDSRVAEQAGQAYYEHRQQIMQQTQLGLTKTYNRFHDPLCLDVDIQEMRRLHAEMDREVLACYGWGDIDLQHNFYPNDRKKIRYMLSREAQREIFTCLLTLNQEIAAKEAVQRLVSETREENEKADDE